MADISKGNVPSQENTNNVGSQQKTLPTNENKEKLTTTGLKSMLRKLVLAQEEDAAKDASPHSNSSSNSKPPSDMTVEQQTELARGGKEGQPNIWNLVLKADLNGIIKLVNKDETVLMQRGPVGETVLHMSLIYNSPKHNEVAKYLISRCPKLVETIYEGEEYYGENGLHITIVNKNEEMLHYLTEREPRLLKGVATGNFFKMGQPCYYGEYPLFFAACTNQKHFVEYLVSKGAKLDAVDSNGNSVLHLLVLHELTSMYDFIESIAPKYGYENLGSFSNAENLTPLTMAASLGKATMFSHLLDKKKQVQWSYGPVTCTLYELEELDTAFAATTGDSREAKGALQHIVEKEHVDLLILPRIIDMLQKKWTRFAERNFYNKLYYTMAYLMVLTFAIILSQNDDEAHLETLTNKIMRYVAESLVLVGALWKMSREGREMIQSGLTDYFSGSGNLLLENLVSCLYCVSIIIAAFLRFTGNYLEDAVVGMACVFGWTYCLFFLLGFQLTGPLVVMMYNMLLTDFLRFTIIYAVFLMGFSQAFYVLFDEAGLMAFVDRIKMCFSSMMGDFELDQYVNTRFPLVNVTLMIVYVVVVAIMLLNLLIAMMGDTYARISEDAEKQWRLQWARIIFSIENEMSLTEREDPANKYWTVIDKKRYLQVQEVDSGHFTRQEEEMLQAQAEQEKNNKNPLHMENMEILKELRDLRELVMQVKK